MEGAYVWVMVHYLRPACAVLMLAGFAAAYMSTIGTHLNLGASYMINDLYKRSSPRTNPNATTSPHPAFATILVALPLPRPRPTCSTRASIATAGVPPRPRRRRRPVFIPALVLVAHQRLVGDRRR